MSCSLSRYKTLGFGPQHHKQKKGRQSSTKYTHSERVFLMSYIEFQYTPKKETANSMGNGNSVKPMPH